MRPDVTQHFHVVQIQQPVCIVYYHCLSIRKVDETAHLLFEAVHVVLDCFFCHHLAHIGSSRRIANHRCTTADQCNWFIAGHLQTLHQTECHKMSDMKAVRRRVKSNVENGFPIIYQFLNFFFVCYLRDQSTGNQFVIYFHFGSPFLFVFLLSCFSFLPLCWFVSL